MISHGCTSLTYRFDLVNLRLLVLVDEFMVAADFFPSRILQLLQGDAEVLSDQL